MMITTSVATISVSKALKNRMNLLRGEKGVEVLLRDAHGRIQGHYMDGKYDKRPIPEESETRN